MNILIGLLIIAVGSFGQSSSYVPIKKVKSWSWESFWLVQGIFAWLVFPLLGAFLAVPAGHSLGELYSEGIPFMSVLYGVLWGVGGLTFGLSMRHPFPARSTDTFPANGRQNHHKPNPTKYAISPYPLPDYRKPVL